MHSRQFRDLIGRFPTGVTVITTQVDGLVHGMTANAVTSVSLDPLLLLVCVGRGSTCHDQLLRAEHFGVNFLSAHQQDLSNEFARSVEPRTDLGDVPYQLGSCGVPLLEGCLGHLECSRFETFDGGDHLIFIGKVESGELLLPEEEPLVFYAGAYRALAPDEASS